MGNPAVCNQIISQSEIGRDLEVISTAEFLERSTCELKAPRRRGASARFPAERRFLPGKCGTHRDRTTTCVHGGEHFLLINVHENAPQFVQNGTSMADLGPQDRMPRGR